MGQVSKQYICDRTHQCPKKVCAHKQLHTPMVFGKDTCATSPCYSPDNDFVKGRCIEHNNKWDI